MNTTHRSVRQGLPAKRALAAALVISAMTGIVLTAYNGIAGGTDAARAVAATSPAASQSDAGMGPNGYGGVS